MDLIERLEKAEAGSRELDAEIMFDLYAKPVGTHKDDGGPTGYLWPEDDPSWSFGIRFPGKSRAWFTGVRKGCSETLVIERDGAMVLMNSLRIPRLTASYDAAMSLMPLGAEYEISTLYGVAHVALPLNANETHEVQRKDGNVILAICEAALRARQSQEAR